MSRFATLITLPCLLIVTGCSTPPFRATEPVSITLPWQDYQHIDVQLPNGRVELVAGERDHVRISGERSVRGATPGKANAHLTEFALYAGTNVKRPEALLVELRVPETLQNKSAQADLKIELPAAVSAHVMSGNGRVYLEGLRQSVTVRTNNGRVAIKDVIGDVDVETDNGRVNVDGVLGSLRVDTDNGRIEVHNVAGNCDLSTNNGRVYAGLKPPANGRVAIRTSNGRVELVLPQRLGMDLFLHSDNGEIVTNVPATSAADSRLSDTPGQARVVRSVQGGGCKVDVRTGNGSITVSTRR